MLFANLAARVEIRYPVGLSTMFESPEAILLLIETSLFAIDAKSDMGFSGPQSATDFEWVVGPYLSIQGTPGAGAKEGYEVD